MDLASVTCMSHRINHEIHSIFAKCVCNLLILDRMDKYSEF